MNGYFAVAQGGQLFLIVIDQYHVVAEIGKTCARN
jgi:hypothetical protein